MGWKILKFFDSLVSLSTTKALEENKKKFKKINVKKLDCRLKDIVEARATNNEIIAQLDNKYSVFLNGYVFTLSLSRKAYLSKMLGVDYYQFQ